MKLLFLGTGGILGVPVWNCRCAACVSENPRNKRLRPSFFVELDSANILIDFGKDMYHQLVAHRISRFNYALLTHAHQDHMDGQEQLTVAGDCRLMMPSDVLEKFAQRTSSWLQTRNPKLKIQEFAPFCIDGFTIDSVKLEHKKDYEETYYPCYGYLFKSNRFSFAYLGDNNGVLEPDKLYGLGLIITDGNCMENKHNGHMGIIEGIELYKRFAPKRMIFTHLSHTIEYQEASRYVAQHGNIELAYDGMEITF